MIRKAALCVILALAPQFASAETVQESIVRQLREQGFSELTLNRTWLGRVRVVAVRDNLRRELVFNPQTGEILRDFWRETDDEDDDGDDTPRIFNPGGGNNEDNDDDDDGGDGGGGVDGDDDENDKDNADEEMEAVDVGEEE